MGVLLPDFVALVHLISEAVHALVKLGAQGSVSERDFVQLIPRLFAPSLYPLSHLNRVRRHVTDVQVLWPHAPPQGSVHVVLIVLQNADNQVSRRHTLSTLSCAESTCFLDAVVDVPAITSVLGQLRTARRRGRQSQCYVCLGTRE